MAFLAILGLGYYMWATKKEVAPDLSKPAPTNVAELPQINRNNPAANDLIKPKSWTYDPRKIGYQSRLKSNIKGPYPQERYLGVDSVSTSSAPWNSKEYQRTYVQQQTAYDPEHYFLDNTYKPKGVYPHPRIKVSGKSGGSYVAPPKTIPV